MLAAPVVFSYVIFTYFYHAGGVRILLTDRSKLVMTVGGVTALAAGVYTTRSVVCKSFPFFTRFTNITGLFNCMVMLNFLQCMRISACSCIL